MNSDRAFKLPEVLNTLIELRGFRTKHNAVADAVYISPSALSQYLSGRTRPSLDTLMRLGDFFETSLDYLVYGTEPVQREIIDAGPVARYLDTALANVQRTAADHSTLVKRISRVLGSQIDEAARSAVTEIRDHPAAGLFHDDAASRLEAYSECTRIATKNLRYDVIETGATTLEGQYANVVAQNLKLGRSYRFLLPARFPGTRQAVESFRRILMNRGVSDEAVATRCLFRESGAHLPVDFLIHSLNVSKLRTEAPLLFEDIRHATSDDGLFGYVLPPSSDLKASATMDEVNRNYALECFDDIWNSKSTHVV